MSPPNFAQLLGSAWYDSPTPEAPADAALPSPAATARVETGGAVTVETTLEQLTDWETTWPAQAPTLVPIPETVPAALRQALERIGIQQLYSHQAKAYGVIRKGKDLVLTPPTAAGKTLAAYVPVLEGAILQGHRCLSLYGLKALASDQAAKLETLLGEMEGPDLGLVKLTGDVKSRETRDALLATDPHLLAMTPDLLHHELRRVYWSQPWQSFLAQLRYVVIDELHTYQGVFGANLCWLLRRLRLAIDACGGHSDHLQFICLSATIGNPRELAGSLISRPAVNLDGSKNTRLTWIHRSGAAAPEKRLIVAKASRNIDGDVAKVMVSLMAEGMQGITFCNSREATKRIVQLLAEEAQHRGWSPLQSQVASFYGSLDESRRRDIVAQLESGAVRWIVATEALEAGIDLPQLDCCILRGFPGSVMSFLQRIGRAGRQQGGLAILIPMATSLLDTHFSQPEPLLSPSEAIHFNPDYPVMVAKHLLCSASESGIKAEQVKAYFGPDAVGIAQLLRQQGELKSRRDGTLYATGYPHGSVNFRGGMSVGMVDLIDLGTGRTVESMSKDIAHREVFAGAIYRRQDESGQMQTFRVKAFHGDKADLEAYPLETRFTAVQGTTDIQGSQPLTPPVTVPLHWTPAQDTPALTLTLNYGPIVQQMEGYEVQERRYERTCLNRKCSQFKKPLLDYGQCPQCRQTTRRAEIVEVIETRSLEPKVYRTSFESPILELSLNGAAKDYLEGYSRRLRKQFQEHEQRGAYQALWDHPSDLVAIHSLGHQLMLALPLVVLHSQGDLEFICQQPRVGQVSGAWFDTSDGGNGATEAILRYWDELVPQAISLTEGCDCVAGCPKCLAQWHCPDKNQGLIKQMGLAVLQGALNPDWGDRAIAGEGVPL